MKKFISLMLVLILALALVACGKKEDDKPVDPTPVEEPMKIAFVCTALGDNSFQDSCATGLEQASKDFGVTVDVKQVGDDHVPSIREAAQNGYDIVVFGYDSNSQALVDEEAKNYPDTIFFMYDMGDLNYQAPANVLAVLYKANESDFVCGAISALMSETKVTSWVGGQEYTSLYDFLVGWVTGVKYADEKATTAYSWVAGDSPWSDPAKAKELTKALYNNFNADIAHGVAGQSGDGVIEGIYELREAGLASAWAVGVDSDQYQVYMNNEKEDKAEVILTSSLKKVAQPVYDLIKTIKAGGTPKLGLQVYGIAEGAAGAADNDYFKKVASAEAKAICDKITADVLSGALTVQSAYGMSLDELNELFKATTANYDSQGIHVM